LKKDNLFSLLLGIANIIIGFITILIIFALQGFFLAIFGIIFLIFGFGLLFRKIFKKLFLYIIIPFTVIFSFNIIMLGLDKDVPVGFQTPLWVGAIILLPFWATLLANFFFLRKAQKLHE